MTVEAKFKSHSVEVVNYLKHQIKLAGGKITFAEYMQHALYAKDLGYYANNISNKFGVNGDFITAPMLGQLFANCIINQFSNLKFSQILNQSFNILELGAGNGRLAYQLVGLIRNLNNNFFKNNFNNYLILETSKELIKQQKQFLLASDLNLEDKNKFFWVDELPKNFNGIILANEVLDALPVNLFKIYNQQIYEKFVTVNHNGDFEFVDIVASHDFSKKIKNLAINQYLYMDGFYSSEICLLLPDFIKSLAVNLNKGAIFLCDYGFLAPEYYHPDRYLGTLMFHYKHFAHHDPFYLPGLQDITAHVDFSVVIDTAISYDLNLEKFSSLAKFLMESNIQQAFIKEHKILSTLNVKEQYKLNQEIYTLISPNEMGEIFKIAIFTKK